MKKLFQKLFNRETILYVIFGVLTTLVNFAVFWLMNRVIGEKLYLLSNVVAWVAAVLFAYVTNKIYVFESKSWSARTLLREIPSFFAARLFSFGIEELLLWLSDAVLHAGSTALVIGSLSVSGITVAKVVVSVITVILNYFFSKLFIFKKNDQ